MENNEIKVKLLKEIVDFNSACGSVFYFKRGLTQPSIKKGQLKKASLMLKQASKLTGRESELSDMEGPSRDIFSMKRLKRIPETNPTIFREKKEIEVKHHRSKSVDFID
ncbi:hypothetical protein BGC07_05290 [Piscirickettsia litoralis]|uniref:Uncharacterized protein n=2 Tax=Piscirickettsia litoralis TaxID=1891921 RepID=A0ABX3A0R9_9GAMM|nr:hypothetical protein BGC07_05290 [Piscirickettsia litoralis]